MVFQPRPAGKVDHHAGKCLIQRHISVPVTADALLVADRLRERLPQRNTDVFRAVVVVDMLVVVVVVPAAGAS